MLEIMLDPREDCGPPNNKNYTTKLVMAGPADVYPDRPRRSAEDSREISGVRGIDTRFYRGYVGSQLLQAWQKNHKRGK